MPIDTTNNQPPRNVSLVRDRDSGVEAVHATFHGHAYDLHQHDEWLVGVTMHGLQEFYCRGARRRSTRGRVILIEPGEVHDGCAVDPGGFSYRMLYLPVDWMREGQIGTRGGDPGFRTTLNDDPALAQAILRACKLLAVPNERLRRDASLDVVLDCLRPHLERPRPSLRHVADPGVALRARDILMSLLGEEIGADQLAREAGAPDRFHLARAFRKAYGTSPHAWLVQRRLVRARTLLREGEHPGSVAVECGFADQSHLGRWFRRAYGVTPAAYRSGFAQAF